MRPPQPRHRLHASSTRTPALVIAFSSLLLSAGLATSLFVFNESLKSQLDGDLDQAAVVAWWAGDAALKWALISATGSLCGVVGILIHNSPLHRVFAVSTFADFLLTLFLTFTFSLLTFTPSLAQPFSSFLCSSLMSSEFSSSSAGHLLHERDSTSWPSSGGIDILLWGVEACEDSWRSGLVKVILGCVVAAALRVYGVWVSWEMNAELRDLERRGLGEGWIDTESSNDGERGRDEHRRGHAMDEIKSARSMEESLVTRSRSASATTATATSQRRSNTLPATGLPPRYSDESPRPRSHSASYPPATGASSATPRPRLVLLPVYVDEQGKPIYSPDSPTFPYVHGASPPAYSLPPRTRSTRSQSSSSSAKCACSPRPPRQRSSSSSSSSSASVPS
ncbi:hypothetical protein JCM10212_006934 [Sporobolomyces blumeae]